MQTIFMFSSVPVLPFWALMILLPRWKVTRRIVASPLIVVPAAVLYILLLAPQAGTASAALLNPTLETVSTLLGTPAFATIAWVHFLAFDLFVGRWVYLDSQEATIHPVLMGFILLLILMVGPAGLLLYLLTRAVYRRRCGDYEGSPASTGPSHMPDSQARLSHSLQDASLSPAREFSSDDTPGAGSE